MYLSVDYCLYLDFVGRVEPVDAVYVWRYNHNGAQTRISAVPFIIFQDLPPGSNVSASLEVHGLNGM